MVLPEQVMEKRGNLYFVCTHCCHILLCLNRPFLIIKMRLEFKCIINNLFYSVNIDLNPSTADRDSFFYFSSSVNLTEDEPHVILFAKPFFMTS